MASGSSAPRPSRETRESTSRPFIGHTSQDLHPRGLASQKDVLCVIAYYREQEKAQCKPVAQMCCNLNKYKEAICEPENGCLQRGEACLTFKVKVKWLQAGIVTISDLSIRGRLCKLQENYQNMFKGRARKKPFSIQQEENYIKEIENTFDIRDENARLINENNPNRTEEAKQEDLSSLLII